MEKWQKLLERLNKDFEQLSFVKGKRFAYKGPGKVFYPDFTGVEDEYKNYSMQILHEVGHAVLKHMDFRTDIERVEMERQAWEKAMEMAPRYGVEIDVDFVENALDSYRGWLHQKAICSECGLTRYQTKDGRYHCPFCDE